MNFYIHSLSTVLLSRFSQMALKLPQIEFTSVLRTQLALVNGVLVPFFAFKLPISCNSRGYFEASERTSLFNSP